jgi:hypothetical protein
MQDGAAVRVSIVCFAQQAPTAIIRLNSFQKLEIFSDLSGRSGDENFDLTRVSALRDNQGIAFQGVKFGGPFEIDEEQARAILTQPTNLNGRPNSDVVRQWCNGLDIVQRPEPKWCLDFGVDTTLEQAALYEKAFEGLRKQIDAENTRRKRDGQRFLRQREIRSGAAWWRHQRPRPEMRKAMLGKKNYIATPEVSKYRVFRILPAVTLNSGSVYLFARQDYLTFGLLESSAHRLWSLRLGTALEDRPRYTPTTCFETFPFPEGLTPNIPAETYASDPRAMAIAKAAARLNELRENWLNPPDLVQRVPEVVPGYPDRILPVDEKAAAILKKRTLTNLYNERPAWLDMAHKDLDAAVAAAYGWPADLSDDEILERLFKLNQERAAKQG